MITDFFSGFSLGLSLILAIGAQNAFILKQGLKRQYVFTLCFIAALSDAILISLGVAGFGYLTDQFPQLVLFAKIGGAVFLLGYGLQSIYSGYYKHHSLKAAGQNNLSYMAAVLTCLAFTWLNPHVYLDTLVLLGMLSADAQNKLAFGSGAVSASFVFFFTLGYGARLLLPWFENPKAWNVLDYLIGIVMIFLAINLLFG